MKRFSLIFCFQYGLSSAGFQDVHVMIYIGFGFLMTFLKRYGYSAVGINLLLASFCAQWAIIVRAAISGNWTVGVMEWVIYMCNTRYKSYVLKICKRNVNWGFILAKTKSIYFLYYRMLTADFAAATILISFGAVLGKTGPLQLLIMACIEIVLAQVNEHIGVHILHVRNAIY